MTHAIRPVHTTPKEVENRNLTLNLTHQMCSVHIAPEEFKNTTISGHFGFVCEEISVKEMT